MRRCHGLTRPVTGWLEDQPSRVTGRMEIRPAAEQGPIIVCLDTSGAQRSLLECQICRRPITRVTCRAAGARFARMKACHVMLTWPVSAEHQNSSRPRGQRPRLRGRKLSGRSGVQRRVHERRAGDGGEGGDAGVHAQRAPPGARLLHVRLQRAQPGEEIELTHRAK